MNELVENEICILKIKKNKVDNILWMDKMTNVNIIWWAYKVLLMHAYKGILLI